MNNECLEEHDSTCSNETDGIFDLNCLVVLLTTAPLLFTRCQWYFKAKMTSEEKRRTNYQNGHGKSIRPPLSLLSGTPIVTLMACSIAGNIEFS